MHPGGPGLSGHAEEFTDPLEHRLLRLTRSRHEKLEVGQGVVARGPTAAAGSFKSAATCFDRSSMNKIASVVAQVAPPANDRYSRKTSAPPRAAASGTEKLSSMRRLSSSAIAPKAAATDAIATESPRPSVG